MWAAVKWQVMSCSWVSLLAILLFVEPGAAEPANGQQNLEHAISGYVRDAKRDIAQSFIKTQIRNRDVLTFKRGFTWKLGTIQGSTASAFRSFNQSFIVAGRVLYRLKQTEGISISTEEVGRFDEFLGEVVFIESVEWDGLLLVLAAYKEGMLQLFTVTKDHNVILRQSIDSYGVPSDAEFFVQEDQLFLAVVANNETAPTVPLVIYRWYGTHLDEENRSLLTAPVALATFPYKDSVIFVVTLRAVGVQKAGLAVLRRSGTKLVMVQYLPTAGPISLQHFVFRSENYLLVNNTQGDDIIAWWSGTELSIWATLKDMGSFYSVSVGYVLRETLLLVSDENLVKIYQPTEGTLQLLDVLTFNESVQSAFMYLKDESVFLFVMTRSTAGSLLPLVMELRLIFQPPSDNHGGYIKEDPLVSCFSQLQQALVERQRTLSTIKSERERLLRTDVSGAFNGKLIVDELHVAASTKIGTVVVKSQPHVSAVDLKRLIAQTHDKAMSLQADFADVASKSMSQTFTAKLMTRDLVIHKANMDSMAITELNGQPFNPNNLLMHSKHQKFTGIITTDKIVVDTLFVDTLNRKKVDDLLRRRGDQTIMGLRKIPHLTTSYIQMKEVVTINDISLRDIVTIHTPPSTLITGLKSFPQLNLQNLAVGLLNNENFTAWIDSLRPQTPIVMMDVPVQNPVQQPQNLEHNGDMKITNLTVGEINGIKFDDLLASLFLKGINQNIVGDVIFTGKPTVLDLTSSSTNDVPTLSLLTKTTHQVINGNMSLDSLSAPDLMSGLINGLKFRSEVAYMNSPDDISTPVAFRKLQVHELGVPETTTIQGKPIERRFLHQPLIKYEGKVKVKGNVMLTDFDLDGRNVLLNGRSITLNDLPSIYWTKSSEQVINVPVVAPSGLTAKSLKVGTINGIQPEGFVNLRSTKVLQGHWSFDSAIIYGNLTHSPRATQLPISPSKLASSVVRTSGTYNISGNKAFLGGLTTRELKTVYLDSKKVSEILQQDLSRGGSFREMRVKGNLIVDSDVHVKDSVNNIYLCDRMSKIVLKDGVGFLPSVTITTLNVSRLNVDTLNGIPSTVWIAPYSGTPPTPRLKKITLRGDMLVPAFFNVLSINNKDVTPENLRRVVDRTKSGVVKGRKTFAGSMIVHGAFNAPHLSGVDLEDIQQNYLSKSRPQGITHPITMAEMSTVALFAEHVNDIPVRSLLSSDQFGRQTIHGNLIFTNLLDVRGVLYADSFEKGCDLTLVAERLQVLDGRRWASVTVQGDLSWERSLSDRKAGLGYYMQSAVTTHGFQVISGEIVFNGAVHTDNVHSIMDINDIDIGSIMKDSLRKSLKNQVVIGEKLFHQKILTSSMRVDGNVVARTVAGVYIQNLNRTLVRVMGDSDVRGRKKFLGGFSADMLRVDGLFNNKETTVFASYDMPKLPSMVFARSLEIGQDLTFDNVNSFSLYTLLDQRVTLDRDQQIYGHITFDQDLNVQGDLTTPSINQIDLVDIVSVDSAEEQMVIGTKHFKESMHVVGGMDLGSLHGTEFTLAHRAALFRDENAVISGNLVFGNQVVLENDLVVDDRVNGVKMADLGAQLRLPLVRNMAGVRSIARTISDTKTLLKARGDLSEFLYLEPVFELQLAVSQTHRAVATDLGGGEVRVDLYGWEWSSGPGVVGACGLPGHCACPVQYTLQVGDESLQRSVLVPSNYSSRSFRLRASSGLTVRVFTSTVSSSSRCQLAGERHRDEITTIAWITVGEASHGSGPYVEVGIDPSPILGYLSDAKLLEVNGKTYIALGLSYNTELDSSEMNSVLLRLDTTAHTAHIIQEFPTKGVTALDVFYSPQGAHLVVANAFASKSDSRQAHVDIYRFDALSEELRLVKSVPTEGALSVTSVVHRGDSLVIIAQDQLFAPVLVLKYDETIGDYHFIQQLISNTVPTGLNVFYIGEPGLSDAFLGVSTADHLFHLYKYCHVEGFKPVMKMELQGVQGFTSFYAGRKQYLFFASSNKSSVFRIVKQSSDP